MATDRHRTREMAEARGERGADEWAIVDYDSMAVIQRGFSSEEDAEQALARMKDTGDQHTPDSVTDGDPRVELF